MNFKKLWNTSVITLLRMLSRMTKRYPAKLRNKTKADFIERIKKHNSDK